MGLSDYWATPSEKRRKVCLHQNLDRENFCPDCMRHVKRIILPLWRQLSREAT